MEYRRYGKMSFSDYTISWIAIIIFLFIAVIGLVLESSFSVVIISVICASIRLLAIYLPNQESFTVENGIITAKNKLLKKEKIIEMPSELTLVLSLADICPPFTIRTAVEKQTHILKNKYAVTIMKRMPFEYVIDRLHQNRIREHSMSTIQRVFDEYQILYSCVCEPDVLDCIMQGRDCFIIVPDYLAKEVTVNNTKATVHIDEWTGDSSLRK